MNTCIGTSSEVPAERLACEALPSSFKLTLHGSTVALVL
jgi:hypothetical protein